MCCSDDNHRNKCECKCTAHCVQSETYAPNNMHIRTCLLCTLCIIWYRICLALFGVIVIFTTNSCCALLCAIVFHLEILSCLSMFVFCRSIISFFLSSNDILLHHYRHRECGSTFFSSFSLPSEFRFIFHSYIEFEFYLLCKINGFCIGVTIRTASEKQNIFAQFLPVVLYFLPSSFSLTYTIRIEILCGRTSHTVAIYEP